MLQAVKNKTLNAKKVARRKVEDIDTWLTEDSKEYKEMVDYLNTPEVIKELKKIQKGPFISAETFFASLRKKSSLN